MNTRLWSCIVLGACALASGLAFGQVRDFPARPVRIVVPSAPGAILDLVARIVGPPMSENMGQTVVVDNRPGAGTNIGMEIVARAAGDGYAMLVASNSLPVNAAMYPKLHVPYKSGGQALGGVIGGEADVTFFAMAAVLAQVKAGKLRALAITSSKRSNVVPQLPTVAEAGVPGYEFTSWVGLLAPGTTPPALVNALNGYIRKAVPVSGMAEKFASEGADVGASTPQEFTAHLKAEYARWSKVVKDLGLRPE